MKEPKPYPFCGGTTMPFKLIYIMLFITVCITLIIHAISPVRETFKNDLAEWTETNPTWAYWLKRVPSWTVEINGSGVGLNIRSVQPVGTGTIGGITIYKQSVPKLWLQSSVVQKCTIEGFTVYENGIPIDAEPVDITSWTGTPEAE